MSSVGSKIIQTSCLSAVMLKSSHVLPPPPTDSIAALKSLLNSRAQVPPVAADSMLRDVLVDRRWLRSFKNKDKYDPRYETHVGLEIVYESESAGK